MARRRRTRVSVLRWEPRASEVAGERGREERGKRSASGLLSTRGCEGGRRERPRPCPGSLQREEDDGGGDFCEQALGRFLFLYSSPFHISFPVFLFEHAVIDLIGGPNEFRKIQKWYCWKAYLISKLNIPLVLNFIKVTNVLLFKGNIMPIL